MTYKYLDKVLKRTNRQIYYLFQYYRALPFDELNVLQRTSGLYNSLDAVTREGFRDLATHYYRSEPHGNGDDLFLYLWLESQLVKPSEVIKYSYSSEVVRKRDRLAEALIATRGDPQEYDSAMRQWSRMTGWFGIDVSDAAVYRARKDDGVQFVKWVSEHDERVCGVCHDLNGTIFPIDDVPTKPHPGCRCHLERVTDGEN